mgnify:CR=1 FL=1
MDPLTNPTKIVTSLECPTTCGTKLIAFQSRVWWSITTTSFSELIRSLNLRSLTTSSNSTLVTVTTATDLDVTINAHNDAVTTTKPQSITTSYASKHAVNDNDDAKHDE